MHVLANFSETYGSINARFGFCDVMEACTYTCLALAFVFGVASNLKVSSIILDQEILVQQSEFIRIIRLSVSRAVYHMLLTPNRAFDT